MQRRIKRSEENHEFISNRLITLPVGNERARHLTALNLCPHSNPLKSKQSHQRDVAEALTLSRISNQDLDRHQQNGTRCHISNPPLEWKITFPTCGDKLEHPRNAWTSQRQKRFLTLRCYEFFLYSHQTLIKLHGGK